MECQKCQRDISRDESYEHLGETLYEDCYMDARSPAKSCDPWAVYSATRTRETAGHTGTEGLNSLQQAIYQFVKDKGKTTPDDVTTRFNITLKDLQNQIATLRHCELVRGYKDGGTIYLIPFEQ